MNTQKKSIGYGIIGVGVWGELHVRLLSREPGVNLVAVCDLNKERAQAVAAQYGIPHVYTDYEEMLRNPEVEAVSVATPDFAHSAPALAVVRAGKHLLIEKPMATTIEECLAIINAAKKAGVTLMVDFHNRWSPPFYASYEALQKDEIGDLRMATFRLSDAMSVPLYFPWSSKSSALWFLGPHSIDTMRWLFQDEVREVYAVSRKGVLSSKGTDTPDFYMVILHFEKGGVAYLEHSWIMAPDSPSIFDLKCQLQGSSGTIYIDTSTNRMMEMYSDKPYDGYHRSHMPDMTLSPVIHQRVVGFGTESIRHFIDSVSRGAQPIVSGVDGLRVTEVILAAEQSAATDLPVKVVRHEV